MNDPLRNQYDGKNKSKRQEDVKRAPREVEPEVADRRAVSPDKAADERDEDGHAGRGRNKILDGQPCHLRKIT